MKPIRFWLIAVLTAAIVLKIPALFRPLTGYFSSYQAINAMMAEMMLRSGWEGVFAPRSFLIAGDAPSLHLLYYPFGSLTAAVFQSALGGSLVFFGRFQALLWNTLAVVLFWNVYSTVNRGQGAGTVRQFVAALFFALAPLNLLMGIAFQNEAFALCALLSAVYLVSKGNFFLLSGLLFSLSITARIHFCLTSPVFLYLLWHSRRPFKDWALFSLASLVPVCGWYTWVWVLEHRYPGQILTSFFSQAGEGRMLIGALFLSTAFWLALAKIFAGVFATPVIPVCVLFARLRKNRAQLFWATWLVCALGVIVLLPRKVIDHPFYLLAALPPACALAADGFDALTSRLRSVGKAAFLLIFVVFVGRFYLPPAFSGHDAPDIAAIGAQVYELTQEGDLVIAESGSSPELLYYTGRYGWPFNLKMAETKLESQSRYDRVREQGYGYPVRWLDNLRKQGADYFVISTPEFLRRATYFKKYLDGQYRQVFLDRKDFIIYDLRHDVVAP